MGSKFEMSIFKKVSQCCRYCAACDEIFPSKVADVFLRHPVCVFSRLDYDRRVSHSYNFTITASDNGSPSHSGSANVRVSVTNVNDEDPVFLQPVEHVLVSEDAPLRTVVHVIQAYDPDGDDVMFAFTGKHSSSSSSSSSRNQGRNHVFKVGRSNFFV